MEVTLRRAIRIRALPRAAVMERTMFKAEKNTDMPACCALNAWFSLLVKLILSPVMPVIIACRLGGQKN